MVPFISTLLGLRCLFVLPELQVTPTVNALEQRHHGLCHEIVGKVRIRLTTIFAEGNSAVPIRSSCIDQQFLSR
jgi:hypothetical protein